MHQAPLRRRKRRSNRSGVHPPNSTIARDGSARFIACAGLIALVDDFAEDATAFLGGGWAVDGEGAVVEALDRDDDFGEVEFDEGVVPVLLAVQEISKSLI